jgi:hypothetical protein
MKPRQNLPDQGLSPKQAAAPLVKRTVVEVAESSDAEKDRNSSLWMDPFAFYRNAPDA